jgi:hypothetical protein
VAIVDFDALPDLQEHPSAYYVRLSDTEFQPTLNTQGAWNPHEQHMAPVSGLVAHALTRHEPRPEMQLARVTYEILGMIPALPTSVQVRTVRPGRTIEMIEAVAIAGRREVIRATAWRLAQHDSAAVAGGFPEPMAGPEGWATWEPSQMWGGGYIRSIEFVGAPDRERGRGRAWIRTPLTVVADEEVSPVAAYLGLVDTANGMNTRVDPSEWMFPNIDVSVHLYREPVGGPGQWVGFDTLVTLGEQGVGLTATTLHDAHGAVGRCEQILTVRKLPPR